MSQARSGIHTMTAKRNSLKRLKGSMVGPQPVQLDNKCLWSAVSVEMATPVPETTVQQTGHYVPDRTPRHCHTDARYVLFQTNRRTRSLAECPTRPIMMSTSSKAYQHSYFLRSH